MDLRAQLKRDEGERLKPYVDTVGKITIGVGHNLTDNGISQAISNLLLDDDIAAVRADLATFGWYQKQDDARKGVLENMTFNLGLTRLLHFPHMLAAADHQDYQTWADEMMNSAWANEVGARATRLHDQVLSGEWQ